VRTKRAIWITLLCAALVGALCVVPGLSSRAQGGSWCYRFDFTQSDGGWTPRSDAPYAEWISGVGWHSIPYGSGGGVYIELLSFSAHVTRLDVTFTNSGVDGVSGSGISYDSAYSYSEYTTNGTHTLVWIGDAYATTKVSAGGSSGSGEGTPVMVIWEAVLRGTDTNPFGSSNCDFTPTPIPTNTPTLTITPTFDLNGPAPRWPYCALLGARSTFREGWQMLSGATLNTAPGNQGLYLPGGSQASTSLSLSPSKRYSVYIAYRAGVSPPSSTATPTVVAGTLTAIPPTIPAGLFFGWRIEGSPSTGWQTIEIPQAAGAQSYSSAMQNFTAMPTGGYALELNNPISNAGGVPLIQYICVSEERTGGGIGGGDQNNGSNSDSGACHACDDPQGVWDVQGIANWIICKIGQLFGCTLAGFLRGIWDAILNLVMGIFAFFKWLLESLGLLGSWAGSGVTAVSGVAGGQVNNVITSVGNGMHDSGLTNGVNIISSGVRDLPTALMNIIDQGGQIIGDTFHSGANLLDVLGGMVNLVISTLGSLLALVPLIFQELVNGFNHATEPVSGSITCTDPGSLLWFPCYGFYVLDNTIFQGPAVYLLPILMGMMAFDTFIWALNKIKDAFAK
jgi:hypothetical protein